MSNKETLVIKTLDDLYSIWYYQPKTNEVSISIEGEKINYSQALSVWYFVFGNVILSSTEDLEGLLIINKLKVKPRVRVCLKFLKSFKKIDGTRDQYQVTIGKNIVITLINIWDNYAVIEVN